MVSRSENHGETRKKSQLTFLRKSPEKQVLNCPIGFTVFITKSPTFCLLRSSDTASDSTYCFVALDFALA